MKKEIKLESKSPKFEIRHIQMSDLKGYWECINNSQTRKGFLSTPKSLAEAKKKLREYIHNRRKIPIESEFFAIVYQNQFAGFISLKDLNKKYLLHKCTIGYCIHPKFRGKGIATAAVKIITKYGFKKYKLKRIEGYCRTFNKASARVLEKVGYKLEGILRKNKFKDGEYLDDMVWAKVK